MTVGALIKELEKIDKRRKVLLWNTDVYFCGLYSVKGIEEESSGVIINADYEKKEV